MAAPDTLNCQRVFKKSSPNNKLTLYLCSRDLVIENGVIDKLYGVLCVDPEILESKKVFGQVTLTFRYGREDEEVMGLKFCNEAVMSLAQLYPPLPSPSRGEPNTPLQGLSCRCKGVSEKKEKSFQSLLSIQYKPIENFTNDIAKQSLKSHVNNMTMVKNNETVLLLQNLNHFEVSELKENTKSKRQCMEMEDFFNDVEEILSQSTICHDSVTGTRIIEATKLDKSEQYNHKLESFKSENVFYNSDYIQSKSLDQSNTANSHAVEDSSKKLKDSLSSSGIISYENESPMSNYYKFSDKTSKSDKYSRKHKIFKSESVICGDEEIQNPLIDQIDTTRTYTVQDCSSKNLGDYLSSMNNLLFDYNQEQNLTKTDSLLSIHTNNSSKKAKSEKYENKFDIFKSENVLRDTEEMLASFFGENCMIRLHTLLNSFEKLHNSLSSLKIQSVDEQSSEIINESKSLLKSHSEHSNVNYEVNEQSQSFSKIRIQQISLSSTDHLQDVDTDFNNSVMSKENQLQYDQDSRTKLNSIKFLNKNGKKMKSNILKSKTKLMKAKLMKATLKKNLIKLHDYQSNLFESKTNPYQPNNEQFCNYMSLNSFKKESKKSKYPRHVEICDCSENLKPVTIQNAPDLKKGPQNTFPINNIFG